VIAFTVIGEAAPAGSKRAFRNPHSGRIMVTDASKGSKPWKARVAATAVEHFEGELLDGPLVLELSFFRPRPKTHYGSGRNSAVVKPSAPSYPATRPDVLKLARGVEDALTGVVWRDDAQIVDEVLRKRYGSPARCEVTIRELAGPARGSAGDGAAGEDKKGMSVEAPAVPSETSRAAA
jgi:Holliday junction resolvase RusA-like endonuclease